jgi:putative ABC transport system permease protein
VLGTALSILTSYLLIRNDEEFRAVGGFVVPWASVGGLVLATVAASVLATVWPAHQAAGIRPAVALRIAD